MQDDTSVDYALLEVCAQRSYDLVASKKHEGSAYTLDVHNNGQQIMPTGHVDVVEVVPAGLTITSFPSGPWTCTGLLPVVGPNSFTCSYQIPSGGIAANSNLPQIVLKSEGTAECSNCMRVKLYLKEFEGGVKPVNEGDMKNNVSLRQVIATVIRSHLICRDLGASPKIPAIAARREAPGFLFIKRFSPRDAELQ